MKNSLIKIKDFENQGYIDFIDKLKKASSEGYIPNGIDVLVNVHGKEIYKAYLSHLDLKKEGIASFFTAQTTQAILLQIVMKKIYEAQQPSLEKHSKILRAQYNITDIQTLFNTGEKSDYWLSVSSSIFDCTHGESWAFFLGGGQSMWGQNNFFNILVNSIRKEYGVKIAQDLVPEIEKIWYDFTHKLPLSILELVVIHDKENFKKTICFTEGNARNPRSPITYDELLKASDSTLQARVLAPNSADPNKIKIFRFTPEVASTELNHFKDQLSKLIEIYQIGKPSISKGIATEDSHSQTFFSPATTAPNQEEIEKSVTLHSKSK